MTAGCDLYPLNLRLTGRLCLVVGGGSVAARKIVSLLSCQAKVRVVSPEVCAAVQELIDQGTIECWRRGYQAGDMAGAFLVFAATSDKATQQQIASDAGAAEVLVNLADDPQQSDFHVPAQIRRAQLLITISTGGASPALSASLSQQMANEYGPEFAQLVQLCASLRDLLLAEPDGTTRHRLLVQQLLDGGIVEGLRHNDRTMVRQLLQRLLPDSVDSDQLVQGIC